MKYLNTQEIDKLLKIEDLTKNSEHVIGKAVDLLQQNLEKHFGISGNRITGQPIVDKANCFTKLNYSDSETTMSEVYTKYISDTRLFRTQMTALVPPVLEELSSCNFDSKLMLFPGMVYRRDVVDRTHVGQPHQLDVWYLSSSEEQTRTHLLALVEVIVNTISTLTGKKIQYRYNETSHHYTKDGIEVEILYNGKWLEILECGLACPNLLERCGVKGKTGLALGMGLDRFVMLVKNIEDIRALRDSDSRIQEQMTNWKQYKVVSKLPATKRDLSLTVNPGLTWEELTEQIVDFLGEEASMIEEMKLKSVTPYDKLPEHVRPRLGISEGQENWLISLTLRHLSKTLTSEEGNRIYTKVYETFHKGYAGYTV